MKMNSYDPRRKMTAQINLWVAPTVAGSVVLPGNSFNILSNSEKKRFQRFLFDSDRHQYLVSHVLLRTVLSYTIGGEIKPFRWAFTHNKYGKPAVDTKKQLPNLHFNLSHSGGLAVVAVSPTCPVGVDIEPLCKTIDADHFDAFTAPGERVWLDSRPIPLRGEDFTRIWTVKEAYAKLLGKGISLDFESFEVTLEPLRMAWAKFQSQPPDDLYLETRTFRMLDGHYHLSLAALCPLVGETVVTLRVLKDLSSIDSNFDDSMDEFEGGTIYTNSAERSLLDHGRVGSLHGH